MIVVSVGRHADPQGCPELREPTRRGTNSRYEPVRRRKVHHPQPRGDRRRPGGRHHGRAQRHRAHAPAGSPAAPGGRHDPQPGHQGRRRRGHAGGRRRGGRPRPAQRQRRHRPTARRVRRAHPGAGHRDGPRHRHEGRVRRHRPPADRAGDRRVERQEGARRCRPDRGRPPRGCLRGARQPPGDQRRRGVDVRVPGEVLRRPHAGRRGRSARPGHRPRRRDPPGHPGAEPADQEQPRPHRRARRRQDRRRRGTGPADRRGRRPRLAQGPPAALARPGRDAGRARSTAASSRSG